MKPDYHTNIKTFRVTNNDRRLEYSGAFEAEVWLEMPGRSLPVSVHTTQPAAREATAIKRAEKWLKTQEAREAIGVELILLGADQ